MNNGRLILMAWIWLSASALFAEALDQKGAEEGLARRWAEVKENLKAQAEKEIEASLIELGEKKMRFEFRVFGERPESGYPLFISMHGGGGAPAAVNDQQWKNQIRLYEPEVGIYVAPRAPTDTWNLWHQGHIDDFFDRLITDFVVARGVDPERVYLMGYSAGGDGVYQLAPRMADRFAAASMMAGHPNDASPLGLRNLPFAIYMGGKDAAYKRNEVAKQWGEKLDELAAADEGGYPHRVKIFPEFGHWMNRKDAEAVPWMLKQTRKSWPEKVVWRQSGGHLHPRFYWLGIDPATAKANEVIRAEVKGQTIEIKIENPGRHSLKLYLRDELIDLDQAVKVWVNGKEVFSGKVTRTPGDYVASLKQRPDPTQAATARLLLEWE